MLGTLPEFLSADALQNMSLAAIAVLAGLALVVLRVVKAVVVRTVMLTLVVVAMGLLLLYRAELEDCAKTCSCSLLGQEIQVPDNPLCETSANQG